MTAHPVIPVTVITGFLGAGKTTLLNRLVELQRESRLAVIINDFGETNIDADLITGATGGVTSLANGCICCSVAAQFRAAVAEIAGGELLPEQILVETSGIAQPARIASALQDPQLRQKVRLESIVTVVDAEQARTLRGEIAHLAENQITAAEILVLNKKDLVDKASLHLTRSWLQGLNPGAPVLIASYGRVPLDALLHAGTRQLQADPEAAPERQRPGETRTWRSATEPSRFHDRVLAVWSYATSMPFCKERLRRALQEMPETVFRAKGFLYLAEEPGMRKVLQKVGRHVAITDGGHWGGTPRSWIVFVGSRGSLDETRMESELEACGVW